MSNMDSKITLITPIDHLINLLSGSRGKLSAKDLQVYMLILKYIVKKSQEPVENIKSSPYSPTIHYILKQEDKFLTTNQIDNALEKLLRAGLIGDKEEGKLSVCLGEFRFEINKEPVELSSE